MDEMWTQYRLGIAYVLCHYAFMLATMDMSIPGLRKQFLVCVPRVIAACNDHNIDAFVTQFCFNKEQQDPGWQPKIK
jgi:hypothetical protein